MQHLVNHSYIHLSIQAIWLHHLFQIKEQNSCLFVFGSIMHHDDDDDDNDDEEEEDDMTTMTIMIVILCTVCNNANSPHAQSSLAVYARKI